ncbi:MAG: hypothetical protein RBT11_01775 [Desulfobacterales bacterium]|nr:hypothetical protein [Desulfobacterales bacterium]
MAGWGFADKVRKMMEEMGRGGRELTVADIALALDLISDADKGPLYRVLCDFRKTGEVERIGSGVYRYAGKGRSAPPEKRLVMWRLLRARRVVSIEDLQELAGASLLYAQEWLLMLTRRNIVRMMDNGKYMMISDPVVMPANEDKAEYLRRHRMALKALDEAAQAIDAARTALSDDEEGRNDTATK